MITMETAIVVSALLASFSACVLKILHESQSSKCTHIELCCISCDRDISNDNTNHPTNPNNNINNNNTEQPLDKPINIDDIERNLSQPRQ